LSDKQIEFGRVIGRVKYSFHASILVDKIFVENYRLSALLNIRFGNDLVMALETKYFLHLQDALMQHEEENEF